MMMMGNCGCCARSRASSSSPLTPGMRMSLSSTSGAPLSNSSSSSAAPGKLVTRKPAPLSAFSSTQRIAWSSSTTQTLSPSDICHYSSGR
jgi:hypothetical protein